MTSTAMLARLRALSDEANAGFWTDANLYLYLDSAQNIIITKLLAKQKAIKQQIPNFEIEALKPLIKLSSAISTSTNPNISLSGISDILEIYQVYLYNNSSGTQLFLNFIPLYDLQRRSQNTYTAHIYDSTSKRGTVYCSLYAGNILTSFNAITTDTSSYYDRAKVYYYSQPTVVGASQDFTLPGTTHDAGIYLALSQAYEQDGKTQEAQIYYQKAIDIINGL